VASILTAKYPYSHGVLDMPKTVLAEAHRTLAEVLRQQGYHTAGFNAHLAFTPKTGFAQGFDDYFLFHSSDEDEMVDRAARWLENNRDQRFFVWVHFFGPHSPYQPPEPWYGRFTRSDYAGPFDGSQKQLYAIGEREQALSDADRHHILALYDGKLALEDDRVGRLLASLDSLGLRESTLVVLTADHGEELFDHHLHFSHEYSVYDGVLRVPLIMSLPGHLPEGRVVQDSLVQTIDLMPTILDVLGASAGPRLQGRSLLPLVARRAEGWPQEAYGSIDYEESILTLRTPEWRYVHNPSGYRPEPYIRIQSQELYDLRSDPGERRNVIEHQPEVARELRRRLLAWKERSEASRSAMRVLDAPDLEARVRALGYVRGPDEDEAPADLSRLLRVLTEANEIADRRASAEKLAALGAEAVPGLAAALQDDEETVRWLAAWSLARIGPPARSAVPDLARLLRDPALDVRLQAIRALGRIGGDRAGSVLRAASTEADESVRDAALEALKRVRPGDP
jgi:arylsulfatase A-like enzyme